MQCDRSFGGKKTEKRAKKKGKKSFTAERESGLGRRVIGKQGRGGACRTSKNKKKSESYTSKKTTRSIESKISRARIKEGILQE